MLHFFEKIDLLGSKFHFYDGVSLQKRTIIGGILTLFIGLCTICFLLYFGQDLFMRLNPNITISIINESLYEYIDLKKENILFAFRLEDFDGHYINELNKLYFKIDYYSSIPDEKGKYRSKINHEYLLYHICNESDFKHENLSEYYGTLYCPDLGGKKFGGYWDNPYIYYFEFQIFFCENGNNYSINNKCTSLNDLRKLLDKDIYFSLYYPVVQFNPLSYNQPLKIKYKNYYSELNYKSQKNDEFILKKTILNDDKGWLFNNIKNISLWGIDKTFSTYKFYTEDDLIIENCSSKIYSLSIYNTIENNYYTRTYTKFQNVIAIVGTLINLILKICIFFTHAIGESLRKLELLNNYFEFEENNETIFKILKRNNSQNGALFSHFNSPIIDKKELNNRKKILFMNQDNNMINLFNEKKNTKMFINAKRTFACHKNIFQNSINSTEQSKIKFLPKKRSISFVSPKINANDLHFKKSYLTLKNIIIENIQIYLFFCCTNKTNYNKYFNVKHANLLQFYYITLIQINRYLKTMKEFDFLKKILLNNYQIKSLNFLKRINLTNENERNYFIENKNSPNIENYVIDYFKSLIALNDFSKIDKLIISNLSEDFKNKII